MILFLGSPRTGKINLQRRKLESGWEFRGINVKGAEKTFLKLWKCFLS